jgi:hypothetical protein
MLEDFRADRSGFIYAPPEDFSASRAKGANLPGIKAFFDAIDRLVSAEEGTLVDAPG